MCKTWGRIRIWAGIKMKSWIWIRIDIKNDADPPNGSLYVIYIPQCS